MESLSPVVLGTTTLAAFTLALAVRGPLERRIVLAADVRHQVRRQFNLDLVLYLVAGMVVVVYNRVLFGFPLVSGVSFLLGCGVLGFFIGLDTALARERVIIQTAAEISVMRAPPRQLYPMTRKFSAIAFAANIFVAIILAMAISRDFAWLAEVGQTEASISEAQRSVMIEIVFILSVLLGLVANLIISYSKNLNMLFRNETDVLEKVSRGELNKLVPVVTSDEFGYIAGHTNTMIQGLRHRSKLLTALKLAEEVQQNLLPQKPPDFPGVDASGISHYCDQTGGDYYDFLMLPSNRLGVIVADAADHGVGSALHMTTARAFLKYGAHQYREPVDFVQQVNRHLTRDSVASGRFMTLFFLEIDSSAKVLRWIRAGHEPAYLYDPSSGKFTAMDGEGIALGIISDWSYLVYRQEGWHPGSIVVIGTDGIREARNLKGNMFGVERLQDAIAQNAARSAKEIQQAVIEQLRQFRQEARQEDDLTLVVVKLF